MSFSSTVGSERNELDLRTSEIIDNMILPEGKDRLGFLA
jgi:hypothetical protein